MDGEDDRFTGVSGDDLDAVDVICRGGRGVYDFCVSSRLIVEDLLNDFRTWKTTKERPRDWCHVGIDKDFLEFMRTHYPACEHLLDVRDVSL